MTYEYSNRLSGMRVLIVEDEYYLADDLSRSLVQAGARVIGPVGSVEEAEGLLPGNDFDCAIIDMNLRGEFTYAIAERLERASVPFIVATGYNRDSLPATLKDVPCVEKPYLASEVVEKLSNLCEQRV